MSIDDIINWRTIPELYYKFSKPISTLKSYIEADEYKILLEATQNDYEARIFSLILCFTMIPSVKCIEHLITVNTPLDKTFNGNPFGCTPQEYLDRHFNFTSNKMHTKARNSIYQAIERGKKGLNGDEHIIIDISIPNTTSKQSVIKRVGNLILSPLIKNKI